MEHGLKRPFGEDQGGRGHAKLPKVLCQEVPRETDPVRLANRQKQVDFGKNTRGYQNYIKQVPRHRRSSAQHVRTPDIYQVCSKRSWDGQVRKWRRILHQWDVESGHQEGHDGQIILNPLDDDLGDILKGGSPSVHQGGSMFTAPTEELSMLPDACSTDSFPAPAAPSPARDNDYDGSILPDAQLTQQDDAREPPSSASPQLQAGLGQHQQFPSPSNTVASPPNRYFAWVSASSSQQPHPQQQQQHEFWPAGSQGSCLAASTTTSSSTIIGEPTEPVKTRYFAWAQTQAQTPQGMTSSGMPTCWASIASIGAAPPSPSPTFAAPPPAATPRAAGRVMQENAAEEVRYVQEDNALPPLEHQQQPQGSVSVGGGGEDTGDLSLNPQSYLDWANEVSREAARVAERSDSNINIVD